MSGRTDLAEHLMSVLPIAWSVIDHDANPAIATTTVMVYTNAITHGAALAYRQYELTVLVLSPKQSGADDELEAALEEVLEAIDLWDYPIDWTNVARVVWSNTYPGFQVTCSSNVRRDYPTDTTTEE